MIVSHNLACAGFFLPHFSSFVASHTKMLINLVQEGRLVSVVDQDHGFRGLEQVADAIDYMYKGKNKGKVIVRIANTELSETNQRKPGGGVSEPHFRSQL